MTEKKHPIGTLAVLVLGLLFAQCLLLAVLFGVRSYRSVTAVSDRNYEQRVALSYVLQRVRAYDAKDTLAVGKFADADALYCYETIDGQLYQTVLYVSGGWLRELYSDAGQSFAPEDGQQIIEAQAMTLAQEGAALQIALTDTDGQVTQSAVYLHGGGA